MKCVNGWLILMALWCSGCTKSTSVVEDLSLQAADSTSKYYDSCQKLYWANEDILIVTASNRLLQAIDAKSGRKLWQKPMAFDIQSVVANDRDAFIALDLPLSERKKEMAIRRFDTHSGIDSTPVGIPQPFLPDTLIWSKSIGALALLKHGEICVYSNDLMSVQTRIPYSGLLPHISQGGSTILLSESPGEDGSCTRIDLKSSKTEQIYGQPPDPNDNSFTVDVPFLSNAFAHADGRLIRIIDNSWSTGRIYFHRQPKQEPREVDSGNGHAVAAIHWPSDRFAVSGTAKNLLVFSTKGDLLAKLENATTERVYDLAFSPSGNKVAALSSNGAIKIFRIQ